MQGNLNETEMQGRSLTVSTGHAVRLSGIVVILATVASILGSAVYAAQDIHASIELQARTLDDGSESFDTLIRAKNGLYIFGCIRKPPGQGPFPGIILVHGGLGGSQTGVQNLALRSTPAQMLVRHGYAILSTDYRSGEWRREYQDVISAYEYFKQLPYVRADAIAMMGGSRGAKLTLDVVTRLRLRAAITCAGPYDLGRYYEYCRDSEFHQKLMQKLPDGGGVGTFMREVVEQFGGTPAQAREKYWEHSGISRVSDVETPLLVVHGERDVVVPPEFGRQLVSALRKQGKSVEEHFAEAGSHSFYWGFPILRGTDDEQFIKQDELFLKHLLTFLDKLLRARELPLQ